MKQMMLVAAAKAFVDYLKTPEATSVFENMVLPLTSLKTWTCRYNGAVFDKKNMDFLASIDMSPLFISLKTAIIATVVAFFGGIACARWAMKLKPLSKVFWTAF